MLKEFLNAYKNDKASRKLFWKAFVFLGIFCAICSSSLGVSILPYMLSNEQDVALVRKVGKVLGIAATILIPFVTVVLESRKKLKRQQVAIAQ